MENTQFPIRYQVLDSIPESVVIGLFEATAGGCVGCLREGYGYRR